MRLEINGLKLFFDVEGAGLVVDGPRMTERPTIVLVHGGPGQDHSYFKPWASRLAAFAQVIYLDLRGNGRSEEGSFDLLGLDQWAADLEAFRQALDLGTPIVLGHSFGGQVAQVFAIRYPDSLSRLILMNTTARPRYDRAVEALGRLGGPEAGRVAERFFTEFGPEAMAEYVRTCMPLYDRRPRDRAVHRRMIVNRRLLEAHMSPYGELHSLDLLEPLGRLSMPILVLTGTDDPIATPAHAADISEAARHQNVKVVCLPDCGHVAFHDAPDATLEAIRAFVTGPGNEP